MGKKIDGFILGAAAAAGLYLYFRQAFDSRIIAAILALMGFVLLRKSMRAILSLLGRTSIMRRRRNYKKAGGAVLQLALLPKEEAQDKLKKLLGKCYEGDYEAALIQNHPDTALSPAEVFECWKEHRGNKQLVLCTTGQADAACRSIAAGLKGPKIAIVDCAAIGQMIAEHPEGITFPDGEKKRARLRMQHIGNLLFNRKNAPRCILLSGAMLMLYVLTGNIFQLVSAMALLFASIASLKRAPRPASLF